MLLTKAQLMSSEYTAPRDARHEPDPGELCAQLRALAQEAHRAVRGRIRLTRVDYGDLRGRIMHLRTRLEAQHLDGLAGYASALERTLEDDPA